MNPLVVTLGLPADLQARFDTERAALFPPGRTVVGAHLTLFHALPGEHEADFVDDLVSAARVAAPTLRLDGLMSLGGGVAYRVESPALAALHHQLQRQWQGLLTRQDQQRLRAHITVVNKVDPGTARRTRLRLEADFTPLVSRAVSLDLWEYQGGPWQARARFPFRERPDR